MKKIAKHKVNRLLGASDESSTPLLTIAIPTYKRFDLLAETLDSVFSLNFTIPIEVIVVDNDPDNEDDAIQAMCRFQGKLFEYFKNTENLGMFGNWNQCLAISKGEFITILHDDDLLVQEFADQASKLLTASSLNRNAFFGFNCNILDQRKHSITINRISVKDRFFAFRSKLRPCTTKNLIDLFFANPFCGTLGVIMDRKFAIQLGGFDSSWYPIADYEFWCRWLPFAFLEWIS